MWSEKAGIPAVGVVCASFEKSARFVARGEGLPDARFVIYPPPNIGGLVPSDVHETAGPVLEGVVSALLQPVPPMGAARQVVANADAREIVFRGTLDEVNDFFRQNNWTDGLPLIPPTSRAVEAMLEHTDRAPNEVLALLPPAMGAATVWKIAVNGVMAGCRPEYMPLLLAVIEAVADPRFGLKYAGSTVGWAPLIILNGPITRKLGFNSGAGVLRPSTPANTTVARFLRLCMTNIAGFATGTTDMATFGRNHQPVLAEAEDESPWEPLSVDQGFPAGADVVTVLSESDMSYHFNTRGTAEQHLRRIAVEVTRELGGQPVLALVHFGPECTPVICIPPQLAKLLYEAGYSKRGVKKYLYDNARIPASQVEELMHERYPTYSVWDAAKKGRLGAEFAASEDPSRLIPLVNRPDDYRIVVTGHWNKIRVVIIAQQGFMGLPVSKEVKFS